MGIDLGYVPGKMKTTSVTFIRWLTRSHSAEVYRTRFGDFYLYLALGGLISVWSIFGLAVTVMVSQKKIMSNKRLKILALAQ